MSYRLDYEEPVFRIVRRLKQEHKEIDRKLERVLRIARTENGNLRVAVSLLNAIKTEMIRHAVEEEARLARVIMASNKTKNNSYESVKILQEHRRIKEFFENELPYLLEENSENKARMKILEFVNLIVKHHREEEHETFPLSLKAISTE
jgi:septal ring factor EnvC (AmiA/AmiB activator)